MRAGVNTVRRYGLVPVQLRSDSMPRSPEIVEVVAAGATPVCQPPRNLKDLVHATARAEKRRRKKVGDAKRYQVKRPTARAAARAWHAANRERVNQRRRERYAADPSKIKKRHAANYRKHRVERLSYQADYRDRNRPVINQKHRERHQRNRDRNLAYQRRTYFRTKCRLAGVAFPGHAS